MVRGFLAQYESTGYLARAGLLDAKPLQEAMGFGIVNDWIALEPVIERYSSAWKRKAYPNYAWLTEVVKKGMEEAGEDDVTRLS